MRTGESLQRVKLAARMPCPHTSCFSRCWGDFLCVSPKSQISLQPSKRNSWT